MPDLSSSVETNDSSRVIAAFFRALETRDTVALERVVRPEATWWWPLRRRTHVPTTEEGLGQHWPREHFFTLMDDLTRDFSEGPRVEITTITAQDDRVSVELEGHGVAHGQVYDNRYHFMFVVRDGQIAAVREYMNTAHVARLLFPDSVVAP